MQLGITNEVYPGDVDARTTEGDGCSLLEIAPLLNSYAGKNSDHKGNGRHKESHALVSLRPHGAPKFAQLHAPSV